MKAGLLSPLLREEDTGSEKGGRTPGFGLNLLLPFFPSRLALILGLQGPG